MNTILVKLSGGLGNQMFQYAAARRLTVLNEAELLLDVSGFAKYKLRTYALGHLSIQARAATSLEITRMTGRGSFFNQILAKAVDQTGIRMFSCQRPLHVAKLGCEGAPPAKLANHVSENQTARP